MGYYDIAQICLNGHITNGSYKEYPEYNKDYCSECGEKTIINCPKCNNFIQGDHYEGFYSIDEPPSYCHCCGEPYPWTKEKLDSANELLALEGSLSEEELNYFKQNLNSILIDTPKTKVVATKLKLSIAKTSSAVGSALRDIFVDIASEAAKKVLFPE
ncbi:DUF2321 domain-containing protein [Clostridium perfringens]|uniref:DUF2321 domain-containing protein n=1 Tax=Clostridium perfringens TaxID=1502 RepID=UPI0028533E10|nr:DUF2321 domain-containing protein [Clostridium perfringens]EJT6340656.1 DUF2321 domain-containing protein [Clostridium perfringens]CAJ1611090.1 hypothetical protein CLO5623_02573 [Clostridium perfringens]